MSYVMILVILIAVVIVVRNKKKASGSPPPRQQLPPAPDAPAHAPTPGGFGRKRVPGAAAPPPPAEERPFGEDITNPDSRTIPAALAGRWTSGSPDDVLVIEPDFVVTSSGNERVVAVRFIGSEAGLDTTDNIAVVTRGSDEQYALHYFGLRSDGCLVDLESADVVRRRAD